MQGDTNKSAEIANKAMIDMADNANKMGTDYGTIRTLIKVCKAKLHDAG